MNEWLLKPVSFRFQLGDWVLGNVSLPMQVLAVDPFGFSEAVETPGLPGIELLKGSNGYAIRNLPVEKKQPTIRAVDGFLCYVPLQYQHCYIDLGWSFQKYAEKFSSKTRSTINRKVRKFREKCGGTISWKSYDRPEDLDEFFHNARKVSVLTYQERLLDVGLPSTEAFQLEAKALAASDRLRAFVLFDGDRPVSYLYCPERDGTLVYAYLGYDPEYGSLSVGTVLQWLAIEKIFEERKFRYFDFTEGNSSHKLLFASHQRLCANVFFVRRTARNWFLLQAHCLTNDLSSWLGAKLDKYGLKLWAKRLLRRG